MDLGLRGKVVLVCGASRGIGFAAAEEFVREGAAVVICGRNAKSLEDAVGRLNPLGAKVDAVVADLSTMEGIRALVSKTLEDRGRVDVLVTNTAGPVTGAPMGHDWATWERAADLLLRSVVELTRAFVPGMRERQWGRVIGITSFAVKRPVAGLVLSNAMRAAVTGYFRTLADDVAGDGVTVNTVMPGYTATERLEELAAANVARTGATRESVFEGWLAETPAGRLAHPSEIGAVVAFLASQHASYLTGQAICVDGGTIRTLL